MSQKVPADEIETLVGAKRSEEKHIARAVSAKQTVYLLHPYACLEFYEDLRNCPWSRALDEGIDPDEWTEDVPVIVRVRDGLLVPGSLVTP